MHRSEELREKVIAAAEVYSVACKVSCKIIDTTGQLQTSFLSPAAAEFCRLVTGDSATEESCRNSHLYGGFQAETLGHYYIYFCPFGLGNWAVPVYGEKRAQYYMIGGPVLLHHVDTLLVEDICRQNPDLRYSRGDLQGVLANIPVVDPTRARYLAQILFALAKDLMPQERYLLEERHQLHVLSEEIFRAKEVPEFSTFELESQLISQVKTGDQQGARETLNRILGQIYFDGSGFELKKGRLIALTAVLARAAIEAGADLQIIFGIEYEYLLEMEETTDLMQLSASLSRVLERFIDCTFSLQNVKNRDFMFKAMNYIRNNYGEDISLEDVASEVGLHPTYFSKLFREEMRMTYTDYLNLVRIEAAKQLIRQECSLVEVAQMVGFNDQSYFSKIFKKLEGVSPGRWRSSQIS